MKKIIRNKIIQSILVLLSGTILSQIILLIASPILARLFNPAEIGALTTFTTILVFISIIMTFRYEVAIVIPKSKREAISIVNLTLAIVFFMTVLLTSFLIFFKEFLINHLNFRVLDEVYFLLPLTAFTLGIINILNFWFIRLENYSTISKSKVLQSSVSSSYQVSSGLLELGSKSLIIGYILGQIASLLFYLRKFKNDFYSNFFFSKYGVNKVAKKYIDFPKFNASQALLNSLSSNFIIVLFAISFSSTIVGLYAMAIRLIQFPIALVTSAVRDVFYKELIKAYNQDLHRYYKKFLIYTLALLLISILPFGLLFIFSSDVFSFILGEEWRESGEYAKYLSVWLFCAFINIPAMLTIQIFKVQKYLLYYEIILFLTRITLVYFSSKFLESINVVAIFSFIGAFFNISLVFIIYYFLNNLVNRKVNDNLSVK